MSGFEGLERDIRDWDGKSAEAIGMVYDAQASSPGFVEALVAMLPDVDLQAGVTWLLKRHVERGAELGVDVARSIYGAVSDFEPWAAKLHVLQLVPLVPVPAERLDDVADFVRRNLDSQKTFVRAWAYGALHALAEADPKFEDEARRRFEKARRSESASVRARLRRLGVEGF